MNDKTQISLTFLTLSLWAVGSVLGASAADNPFIGNPIDNPANYNLSIHTDKSTYDQSDTITIYGSLTTSIQNMTTQDVLGSHSSITLLIFNGPGAVVNDTVSLDDQGNYRISYPNTGHLQSSTGQYRVGVIYLTGAERKYPVEATTTFSINGQNIPVVPAVSNPSLNYTRGINGSINAGIDITSPISSPAVHKIPNWVKSVFGFYAQGNLSDDDLIKALQFLIQQGIIKIS